MLRRKPPDLVNGYVGGGGTILHRVGGVWSKLPTVTTTNLSGIWGSSSTDVYAVGGATGKEVILHFDGKGWATTPVTITPGIWGSGLLGVWGSGPTDIFAVGYPAVILHHK